MWLRACVCVYVCMRVSEQLNLSVYDLVRLFTLVPLQINSNERIVELKCFYVHPSKSKWKTLFFSLCLVRSLVSSDLLKQVNLLVADKNKAVCELMGAKIR